MGRSIALAVMVVLGCGSRVPPPPPPPASPGPLAAVHGALACADCHVDGTKAIANARCVACHDLLRARIAAGKGFHASRAVAGKPCGACHLEHRGRAYDLTGWSAVGGRDRFDHDLAGWPLDGAHRSTACDGCHRARDRQGLATYAGTDRLCGACHPDTVHGFTSQPMRACDRCHRTDTWRPAREELAFNHDDRKDAAMSLLGVHKGITCVKCHPAARFKLGLAEPDRCDHCHASPHAGDIMTTRPCDHCHSPMFRTLKAIAFDHTEKTRFDLGIGHRQLPCARCHTAQLGAAAPPSACEVCHASRSPHGHRFDALGDPPACARCHSASAFTSPPTGPSIWRPTGYAHGDAALARIRKHAELVCRDCHRALGPGNFERLAPADRCMDCHAHARVHDGRFGNDECLRCHQLAY